MVGRQFGGWGKQGILADPGIPLGLTRKSGQTHEAVKFLEDYIEDLLAKNNFSPSHEHNLLTYL
jgi:hypothetical protein